MRKDKKNQDELDSLQGWSRPMTAAQGVSYPRSGHGFAKRVLGHYFGPALVYCDAASKDYCGCNAVPCVNPERTFSKHHDFEVASSAGTDIITTERYFVQYRSPVRSIVSNYYLFRRNNRFKFGHKHWQQFALHSINYWNRFVDKWVLDFPGDAHPPFYCSYESLVADPEARIREILAFFSEGALDEGAAGRTTGRYPVKLRDLLSTFRFHDAGFLRELEEMAGDRLRKLNLPSFTDGV